MLEFNWALIFIQARLLTVNISFVPQKRRAVMKAKEIIFTKINTAELCDIELPELAPDAVAVKTMYSAISQGTERANITGAPNTSIYSTETSVKFPRVAGYSSAGVVIATGSAVTGVKIGDRVAVYWGLHRSINVVSEDKVVKIEDDGVSLQSAALSFIASFSMAAIRKCRVELGESALVMGAGILGLLSVKLLRAAGSAPVIIADPDPVRREKALLQGADYAFDPTSADFAEEVKGVTDGGVKVAIEVSGVGAGFNGALDCMAKFGRVALLGCTRNSDFTVDYYRKIHGPGITVIGAHTLARPEAESHPGWFTHRDDIKAILKLCALGRLDLDGMIEETYSPSKCGDVYSRLINGKDFPIVVEFDWSEYGV